MPSIKDDSTVEAIALEFTSNGRVKAEALRTVGYKDSYCDNRGTGIVYTNDRVIAAIARIDAANQVKCAYNYDIAMQEINALIATCKDDTGKITANTQAKSLLLQAIKEKNSITGLQKQVITNKTDEPIKIEDPVLTAMIATLYKNYHANKKEVG